MVDATINKQSSIVQAIGLKTTLRGIVPVAIRAIVLLVILCALILLGVYALQETRVFPAISLILTLIMSLAAGIAVGILSTIQTVQQEREKQAVITKMREHENDLFETVRRNLNQLM